MNKRIYFAGIVIALIGVFSIWAVDGTIPKAVAATDQSHAGHDHEGGRESVFNQKEDMDALFAEDDHKGHGHAEANTEGRDEDHAGHGDEEEASSHAGHGHGDLGGICPEHRVPEAEDALCNGGHLAELQPGEGMKVRLASPDVAAKAGVGIAKPQEVSLAAGIEIPGRVEFNRNRLAHITSLATGVVRRVHVRPGAQVGKGEVLAEVAMPEIASLKAQLLAAQARQAQTEAAYQREMNLLERGISSRQEYQQAESEHRAAQSASEQYRLQLMNFGLSPANVQQLLRTGDNSALVSLRAPFAGTVVEMKTAVGEAAAPGTPLFTVANLDVLWIELSLPESRIYQARIDAPVQTRFDGLPGTVFSGRIFQVGAAVDERTRTLKALAEVKNPGQRLKVGMFGKVRLLEGNEEQVLAIPADALQSIDGLSFVFVQQEPGLFELRRVQAGARKDGIVPILAGLSLDEQVVSSQGFALKSEVLKARLGASCADH